MPVDAIVAPRARAGEILNTLSADGPVTLSRGEALDLLDLLGAASGRRSHELRADLAERLAAASADEITFVGDTAQRARQALMDVYNPFGAFDAMRREAVERVTARMHDMSEPLRLSLARLETRAYRAAQLLIAAGDAAEPGMKQVTAGDLRSAAALLKNLPIADNGRQARVIAAQLSAAAAGKLDDELATAGSSYVYDAVKMLESFAEGHRLAGAEAERAILDFIAAEAAS